MELSYVLTKFENINLKTRQAVKLRGFFASHNKDNELLHNHHGERLIYQYPKVQYKVIKGVPIICGLGEGAELIIQLGRDADSIRIDEQQMSIYQKEILIKKESFGVTDKYIAYRLITPWIALNQKNSKKYYKASDMEKEELLKKILVGNILSMAKGLNYDVKERIYCWLDLKECTVQFKNIKMKAFKGKFKVNFKIPDYLGLGKSVSRGFGTIKGVENCEACC